MTTFDRYIGAQMHCHSSIEGPASIGAHCYEAHRAGVEVVWLTDHDTRISLCIGGPFITAFDFEAPDLLTAVERTATGGGPVMRQVGWSLLRRDPRLDPATLSLTRETAATGRQSMCLEGAAGPAEPSDRTAKPPDTAAGHVDSGSDDDWQEIVAEFKADAKLHSRPLLAGVALGLAVRLDGAAGSDTGAWIDLLLSEQPPDLRQVRLRYWLGQAPDAAAGPAGRSDAPASAAADEARYRTHPLSLAVTPGQWTHLRRRPADDAAELGGADNALTGLRVGLRLRRGARLRLFVDDLTITHEYAGNALHARQRVVAGELGRKHGVTCHVAQEISQAGQHKNAWGAAVPLLDYPAHPEGFSQEAGVAWARQHGAPFSLNHPFVPYQHRDLDAAGRERAVVELIEHYRAHRAWGADTLEVGFPIGRYGFDLDHHLRLWDGLTARHVFLVGSASSDAHSARVGWQAGNNFATYIRAAAPDEAPLLQGLRSGDVYLADPVRFRSRLSLHDHAGRRMGSIVADDAESERELVLTLDAGQPGWRLCWVVDGARLPSRAIPAGVSRHVQRIARPAGAGPATSISFARAEIWDGPPPATAPATTPATTPAAPSRCIALTNPICYLDGPLTEGIPAVRLVNT